MKTALIIGGNKGIGLEIAKAMLWLATESPEYINGTTIDVNNGSYMRKMIPSKKLWVIQKQL